jgi:hypothetical protein
MKSFTQRLTSCLGYTCAYFFRYLLSAMFYKQAAQDDTIHSKRESFPNEVNETNPDLTYRCVGLTGERKCDRVSAPRRAAPS